jgi:hypothetical protein
LYLFFYYVCVCLFNTTHTESRWQVRLVKAIGFRSIGFGGWFECTSTILGWYFGLTCLFVLFCFKDIVECTIPVRVNPQKLPEFKYLDLRVLDAPFSNAGPADIREAQLPWGHTCHSRHRCNSPLKKRFCCSVGNSTVISTAGLSESGAANARAAVPLRRYLPRGDYPGQCVPSRSPPAWGSALARDSERCHTTPVWF